MRIAALDDDALQLQLLEQVVTEAGHSCHNFLKGAALQQALRRESFDLLLVDWELPDIPGTQVVHWVREQISKELPIIFITHRSEEADIIEGLASGADDFMIKPIRAGELRARISSLLPTTSMVAGTGVRAGAGAVRCATGCRSASPAAGCSGGAVRRLAASISWSPSVSLSPRTSSAWPTYWPS